MGFGSKHTVAKHLTTGDFFFSVAHQQNFIVAEKFYAGGGFIGTKNYEGIDICITNCGREILLHEKDKVIIKTRNK